MKKACVFLSALFFALMISCSHMDQYDYSRFDACGITVVEEDIAERRISFLGNFSEGLAPFADSVTGLYGYISCFGNIVIPAQFENAMPFSNGLASVKSEGKWGAVNTGGAIAVYCVYRSPLHFENGLSGFERMYSTGSDKVHYGFINLRGRVVSGERTGALSHFRGGFAKAFIKDAESGAISKVLVDDELLTVCDFTKYDDAGFAEDGMLKVIKDGKYGFLNLEGGADIACAYASAGDFKFSLCPVTYDGLEWFFIDKSGERVFGSYLYAADFSEEGLACVSDTDEQYYFIETDGERAFSSPASTDKRFEGLIPLEPGQSFASVSSFTDGVCPVLTKTGWRLISKAGHYITGDYDMITLLGCGMAEAELDEKTMLLRINYK